MTGDEKLELVVRLACETQDRAGPEQRALLDVALRLDLDQGKFTITNRTPKPPTLTRYVMDTYEPGDAAGARRPVVLTGPQRTQLEALEARWRPCGVCGAPMGAHGADSHPRGEKP